MSEQIPHTISLEEAAGMTVNERLWVSGLMADYDAASDRRDIEKMREILKKIHLDEGSIEANIAMLRK